jgi:hypothetical protein
MRYYFVFIVLACLGCVSAPQTERKTTASEPANRTDSLRETPKLRHGITEEGTTALNKLLGLQGDVETFAAQLEEVATSGKPESMYILTHLMFELPWLPRLAPGPWPEFQFKYHDTPMPKLVVERRLDDLVAAGDLDPRIVEASDHEYLSAMYLHALEDDGDIEAAKNALMKWYDDNSSTLMWTGERYVLKTSEECERDISKRHRDGAICLEGTKNVPPNFTPCCLYFAGHLDSCIHHVRFEWWESGWVIVCADPEFGGGYGIDYCPHCGTKLIK